MTEAVTIVVSVLLGIAVVLLVSLSMTLASLENAVRWVTRASMNNMVIDLRTDGELSEFMRGKRIHRVYRIQRLVADRSGTGSACSYCRVLANVFTGTCVGAIMMVWGFQLWVVLLAGFLFSIVVALIVMLTQPRNLGNQQPLLLLMKHATLMSVACRLAPFASRAAKKNEHPHAELSDDEELEKLQLDQGRAAIDRIAESNNFDDEISEMLRNVLTLADTLTREIMVPRTDMITINEDAKLGSFLKLCSRSGFSRIPVIGDDVDDLIGIAYLKDAVRATAFNGSAKDRSIASIVRKPMLVPESKPVDDLFHEMQQTRHHVAVVVDEYGGIAGMVTIEDALEQIVGELEDEHDRTQHAEPHQRDDGAWLLPARTPIAELEELFEVDLDEDDVDTVYGLLTKLLGRVPIVGSSVQTHGIQLTAVDSAGRRKKVSMIVAQPAAVDTDTETGEQREPGKDQESSVHESDRHDEHHAHSAEGSKTSQHNADAEAGHTDHTDHTNHTERDKHE
ncbi:hemolysin family protein [Bifidobacterium gallicum]|uniref:CBS domain protein n=1 Tax=Bifidobacterium gallicum DSM 20093 = LMG 11596 TaxID=561180 RepID=D1NSD7_9BIFI|nr:hemolysin family protein [Bifidobacterium gallicum]EFA23589.1 CBS domain protein [Bifidobacterium gallicum DSM 20093 = LMG 11596]KFI58657.1 membrane protein [Bifidobacterium gallicum DSM 20093 = LMG 11596]